MLPVVVHQPQVGALAIFAEPGHDSAAAIRGNARRSPFARLPHLRDLRTRPVGPNQLPRGFAGALINQRAVARRGDRSQVQAVHSADVFGQRHGLAHGGQAGRIETLGQEFAVADEQDIAVLLRFGLAAGGVRRVGLGREKQAVRRRIERPV